MYVCVYVCMCVYVYMCMCVYICMYNFVVKIAFLSRVACFCCQLRLHQWVGWGGGSQEQDVVSLKSLWDALA